MILTHIISFIVFPIMIILSIKKEERTDLFNKEDSMMLRGCAASFIMLAHFYNMIELQDVSIGIGKVWLFVGGIGVLMFFFLSGYGLNKANSIEQSGFLLKRLKGVLFPYMIIRAIVYVICFDELQHSVLYFLGYLVGVYYNHWYITLTLILYVGYFLCYKIFGKKYLNLSMLAYNIVIAIIFILLDFNQRWYNGHLLFSVGMIVADYNEQIVRWIKKAWLRKGILAIVLFGVSSVLFTINKGMMWANIFKMLGGVMFFLLIGVVLSKIRINSKILMWIGKNSLFVYVIHVYVIKWIKRTGKLYLPIDTQFLFGILATFVLVGIYNFLSKILKRLIKYHK